MDRSPSFYPTSEVLRMHPDWPLLRPRTPPGHSESEWTAYSRTSSRSSSYHDMSNSRPQSRPNWPFPTRTSSLASHLAGDYADSLREVPWYSPPNLTSAFDPDSEDEDDKPSRLVRKLKKKSSSPKGGVDRHILMRSVGEETHSLSQGQHSRKDSAMHSSRKWSILLSKMSRSTPKSEKPDSDKNLDSRRSRPRFFYENVQRAI